MSAKENYFRKLSEWETAELFFTDRTDLLEQEISRNCIRLAQPPDGIPADELVRFLDRVKENRRKQLSNSSLTADLIYYLWFDEPAGVLCINFINSNHSSLPFRCALRPADSEKRILECFLHSSYASGIPLAELEETNDDAEEENSDFFLDVFIGNITRNRHGESV